MHAAALSRNNALIIMGSENNGVSPEILSMVTDRLFIPPYPIESTSQRSESLNVAIASAILCYEFRKG
jgi:TrmH family RNA methyltransferase